MAERPILFNGAMVRAILAGKKRQTRRPVKFPAWVGDDVWLFAEAVNKWGSFIERGPCDGVKHHYKGGPFGKAGDTLWGREAFRLRADHDDIPARAFADDLTPVHAPPPWYEADPGGHSPTGCAGGPGKLRPSIHMPRWASRLTLDVLSVRVERVQSITEDDALAEGFDPVPSHGEWCNPDLGRSGHWTARKAFHGAWVAQYGDAAWDCNPWVWVVDFERRPEVPRG